MDAKSLLQKHFGSRDPFIGKEFDVLDLILFAVGLENSDLGLKPGRLIHGAHAGVTGNAFGKHDWLLERMRNKKLTKARGSKTKEALRKQKRSKHTKFAERF
jgi:hypothetical protein